MGMIMIVYKMGGIFDDDLIEEKLWLNDQLNWWILIE